MRQTATSSTQFRGTADALLSIARTEGVRALYRGAGVGAAAFYAALTWLTCQPPVWSFTVPAHAVYFLGYEHCKRWLEPTRSMEEKSARAHFLAGIFAEVCGSLIWTPMDIIKQRQQMRSQLGRAAYSTVPSAVRTIFREQGIRGFFTGIGAALATYGPFVGIYFVFYERWKRYAARLLDTTDEQLPFAVHLSGGAVAGGVSALTTTPLDVIKTRLQTSVDASGRNLHKTTLGTATSIWRAEGARAFFKGATARVLWIAPGTAITIAAYEQSKRFLEASFGWPAP